VRTHKLYPKSDDGSKENSGHEGVGLSVVTGGDTSEVLEAAEEALDAVA
jgi:hypothetical protein